MAWVGLRSAAVVVVTWATAAAASGRVTAATAAAAVAARCHVRRWTVAPVTAVDAWATPWAMWE